MSKGPTPRHSKSPKPVTIDLDATDVTPKNEDLKAKSSATGPSVARTPDPVKPEEPAKPGEAGDKVKQASAAAADPKSAASAKPASDAKSGPADTAATKAPLGKTPDSKSTASKDSKTESATPKAAASETAGAASAKPQAASGKSSGGGLGMVMSGVIGAVFALGGGYALQAGGVLPVPGVNGDPAAPVVSRVDALSSEVETLSQQLAGFSAQTGPDGSAELAARLDSLEAGLADVAARSGEAGSDTVMLAPIEERIAGLESQIAELGQGSPAADPALAAEINELRAAQSGMQTSLSELKSTSGALSDKLSRLESDQAALTEQVEAPSRQIDVARAIAAAGLKSAIDRGGSFMSELEAFASVAPDDPAVAELRDLAARGVPSRSDLVAGFSDAASTAIAAADPGNPDAGLVDRLMSSAMSVVKVRKVGDVPGDSAEAIAARAEARLLNGDLDAAVSEWNTLPETSLAATADYGDALAARARAEKLIAAAVAPSGASAAPSSEAPAN
ncbi:mitofilin family membrane protein [uncultured Hoeflea sp.]|uniref:COG4223 family protein n=1 Tax=uncultured Hoeflea sp. TaxID=538666 RepID=UPI0030DD21FD